MGIPLTLGEGRRIEYKIPVEDERFHGRLIRVNVGRVNEYVHLEGKQSYLVAVHTPGCYIGLPYLGEWPDHVLIGGLQAKISLESELPPIPVQLAESRKDVLSRNFALGLLNRSKILADIILYSKHVLVDTATHDDIAWTMGCTREAVSRSYPRLKRDGSLVERDGLWVLNEELTKRFYEQERDGIHTLVHRRPSSSKR